MNEWFTVYDLLKECEYQIEKGNGNKKIYISSDDEWNDYHQLFFTFTDWIEDIKALDEYDSIEDKENAIILG
jgi:hypothetical protein